MLYDLVSDDKIFVESFCYQICNDYTLKALLLYKINKIKEEKYTENRFSLSAELSTKQKVFPKEEDIDTTLLKILVAMLKQGIQITETTKITEIETDDFIIEILNINYLNLEKELEIIEFYGSYKDDHKMGIYKKLEPVLERIDNLYKEILLENKEQNLEKAIKANVIDGISASLLNIKRKSEDAIEEGKPSKRMRI